MKALEKALEPIREIKREIGEEIRGLTGDEIVTLLAGEDDAFRAAARNGTQMDLSWLLDPVNKAA
jgi:hypothetical protein